MNQDFISEAIINTFFHIMVTIAPNIGFILDADWLVTALRMRIGWEKNFSSSIFFSYKKLNMKLFNLSHQFNHSWQSVN